MHDEYPYVKRGASSLYSCVAESRRWDLMWSEFFLALRHARSRVNVNGMVWGVELRVRGPRGDDKTT